MQKKKVNILFKSNIYKKIFDTYKKKFLILKIKKCTNKLNKASFNKNTHLKIFTYLKKFNLKCKNVEIIKNLKKNIFKIRKKHLSKKILKNVVQKKNNYIINQLFKKKFKDYFQNKTNLTSSFLIKYLLKNKLKTRYFFRILNKPSKKLNVYSLMLLKFFFKEQKINSLFCKKDFIFCKRFFLFLKKTSITKILNKTIKLKYFKNNLYKNVYFLRKFYFFLIKNTNKFRNKYVEKKTYVTKVKELNATPLIQKISINKICHYFFLSFFNQGKKQITRKILLKKPFHLKKNKPKSSLLYKKILGLILKKGKKTAAFLILEKALQISYIKLKLSPSKIIRLLFKKLKSPVELKKIRVRRSFHFVPFPINIKRKTYLVAKWLLSSILKNKTTKKTFQKLSLEIIKVIQNKKSLALKTKKYNISNCFINRSNKHFRW